MVSSSHLCYVLTSRLIKNDNIGPRAETLNFPAFLD